MGNSRAGALGRLVLIAACGFVAAGDGTAFAQEAKNHSFRAPRKWSGPFPADTAVGFGEDPPFKLADVNADGRKDLVHFGHAGVTVGLSTGTSFQQAFVLAQFGGAQGWNSNHVRTVGDVSGDGRADIVGFGPDGVYVSFSTPTGFTAPVRVVDDLGFDQGWRTTRHTRILADVDNNGRQDLIGFGEHGVWLSRSTIRGFTQPEFVLAEFGSEQDWNPTSHIRTTADVNGDHQADIVAFGDHGVWIALSTGTGFAAPQFALADFAVEGGWLGHRFPRVLADVDRDGRDDIVGFGATATWMARSNGAGFDPTTQASGHFGNSWLVSQKARTATDLNDDGYPDLLFVGDEAIFRILGGPHGFGQPQMVLRALVFNGSFSFLMVNSLIGDVNGDGLADLVGASGSGVRVALSSNAPPPPPPANPTNARIVSKTHREVKIAWNDNSTDETAFIVHFGPLGETALPDHGPANVANRVIRDLDPDREHCFTVQAENVFALGPLAARICTRTNPNSMPGPPLDRGLSFPCGAPAACPAGFHAADFVAFLGTQCVGQPLEDNQTVCAANGTEPFTACGACPAGFDTMGMRFFEYSCALPNTLPQNAARCAQIGNAP